MKVTVEQYNKWKDAMGQNFFPRIHSDGTKEAIQDVAIEGTKNYVRIRLYFMPEYETVKNEYGVSYNQRTGRHIPVANINKLVPGHLPGLFSSFGLGKTVKIGEPCNRQMFNTLIKLTHTVNLKELVEKGLDEPESLEESKQIM